MMIMIENLMIILLVILMMMTLEMMMLGDQGRANKQHGQHRGHQGKGKASNIIQC